MHVTVRRLGVAASIWAVGLLAACHPGGAASAGGADMTTAPEMTLGNPSAKVKVVEYASDTCIHCAHWEADYWPQFKARYVDTGKVTYSFREFLTSPEQVAAAGFLLARCAGRDRYFQVVQAIFRGQDEMFKTGDAHGVLLRIAQSMGMSEAQFNACEQNEAALKALAERVQRAEEVDHIQSTPTFLVDGKKVEAGPGQEADLAMLDNAIRPLLR